jgi:hypothetical protein
MLGGTSGGEVITLDPESGGGVWSPGGGGFSVNVAVTDLAVSMVTTQPPVPAHASLQPAKLHPADGVGVRVTAVPSSYTAEHGDPQAVPCGLLVTVPLPFVRTDSGCWATNVADTVVVWLIVTLHVPGPEHPPPLHPPNRELPLGVAVRSTPVPGS